MAGRGKVTEEVIEKETKGYRLEYNEVWLEQPPEVTLYKFLTADGVSPYQLDKRWSLPTQDAEGNWIPGEWREEPDGQLITCQLGLHLFQGSQVTSWVGTHRDRLFVAEVEGGLIDSTVMQSKYVARKVRLVREIVDFKTRQSYSKYRDPDVSADIGPYLQKYKELLPKRYQSLIGDTWDVTAEQINKAFVEADRRVKLLNAKMQVRRWKFQVARLENKPVPGKSNLDRLVKAARRTRNELQSIDTITPFMLMVHIEAGSKFSLKNANNYYYTGFDRGNKLVDAKIEEIRERYKPLELAKEYGDVPQEIVDAFATYSYGTELTPVNEPKGRGQ